MAKPQPSTPKTYIKEIAGETHTREVSTPQAEVAAAYDGYRPAAVSSKTASTAGGSTSTPKSSS